MEEFIAACDNGNLETVKSLWCRCTPRTKQIGLEIACAAGQLPIVQYLIETCDVKPDDKVHGGGRRESHINVLFFRQEKHSFAAPV